MITRVTCPVCGRTDRALTLASEIRHHKDPNTSSLCEGTLMTLEQATWFAQRDRRYFAS